MLLAKVRKTLENHGNHAKFMSVVSQYFPPDDERYLRIQSAYQLAKNEFRGKYREGGERYFEHLRAVAIIVMVHLRIRDPDLIITALLHDLPEDIEGWSYEKIKGIYGSNVASLIWYVTKPKLEEFGGDKKARDRRYHENLMHALRGSIIVKLADRLHNLLTQWDTTEEKRQRKIAETQDFYLTLAEKETILIHELEDILVELQQSTKTNK